jgi:hypothetical protein
MSLTIDEDAVREHAAKESGPTYIVKALNLVAPDDLPPVLLHPSSVASTASMPAPTMSAEIANRLLDLRQKIVQSGSRLLSTVELDREVAEHQTRAAT